MAWLSGWNYRNKLTIDSSKIDASLSDFPIKVILDDDNFDFSKALSTGNDIRFTSSDGKTLLKYERELHQVISNPNGLLFDGVNDAVDCGDVSAIDSASALTVECRFVYMGTGGVWGAFVSKMTTNGNYRGFALQSHATTHKPRFVGLGADQYALGTTTMAIGQEYHMAGVWTGSKLQVFLNGVMEAEINSIYNIIDSGTEKLWIGKRNWGSIFSPGIIMEVRVWTVAKTESQINASKAYGAITGSEDNLECLYLFDEGTGTTLTDSANSNHGTISGATWTTSPSCGVYHVKVPTASSTSDTDVYMYYGKSDATDGADPTNVWDSSYKVVHHMVPAISDSTSNGNDGSSNGTTAGILRDGHYRGFDGDADYIDIAHDATLVSASQTVECFLSTPSTPPENVKGLVFKAPTTDGAVRELGLEIGATTGYMAFAVSNGTSLTAVYTGDVCDGNNHYVAARKTYGATNDAVSITLDDASPVSNNMSGHGLQGTEKITVGRVSSASTSVRYYVGKFHELRISSSARSDAWIKATHASLADTLLTYGAEEALTPTARPRVMVVWA